TCSHCDAYAHFRWEPAFTVHAGSRTATGFSLAFCARCRLPTAWLAAEGNQQMVWPLGITGAPLPHEEMPDSVKVDYLEARGICNRSPRGAAALLRLAIQKMCFELVKTKDDLNAHIATLVKQGLPVQIQQALDVVRVTGNNAVHPGELNVDDKPEIVAA